MLREAENDKHRSFAYDSWKAAELFCEEYA